jgi:iron(III) transport system ATP-binding protein
MSAIELAAVSKSFGATPVLHGIDLTIPEGSRTVIVGSSGSGKTTLLRLLSGFEVPDTGSITIAGRAVVGPGGFVPAHRRGIGYVSQDGSLFPHLTVGENVAFGVEGRGRDKTVRQLLAMVSLDPDFAKRRPDQLSGGQQQRVALARALARRPRVMLLDEPFSALDAGLRAATRESVAQLLANEGITTVLVTHDQAEALSFAHQLAILREGGLAQVGTPQELYARPVDLRTSMFLGDAIVIAGTVTGESAVCALGRVDVAPTPIRGAATLMIRPEQLRIDEVRQEGSGVVEAAEFYGSNVVLTIRLGTCGDSGRRDPVIRVPQPSNDSPAVGSAVRISISGSAMAYRAQA